ncbi:MAG: hypothetical protein WCG03_02110 [Kiritimatiellales bacterium]
MGLFNFLKKPSAQESVPQAQSKGMSLRQAEKIVQECGAFLANSLPVIRDEALLPYSKETINQAHAIGIEIFKQRSDSKSVTIVANLVGAQTSFWMFATIDSEDQKMVDHFNQFKSRDAVPKEEQQECCRLFSKYMKRGMGNNKPGRVASQIQKKRALD